MYEFLLNSLIWKFKKLVVVAVRRQRVAGTTSTSDTICRPLGPLSYPRGCIHAFILDLYVSIVRY